MAMYKHICENCGKEFYSKWIAMSDCVCDACEKSDKYQDNIAKFKAELARYKQEVEKIPYICYKYRYDPDECIPNDKCPMMCPRWKGSDRDENPT